MIVMPGALAEELFRVMVRGDGPSPGGMAATRGKNDEEWTLKIEWLGSIRTHPHRAWLGFCYRNRTGIQSAVSGCLLRSVIRDICLVRSMPLSSTS